MTKPIILYNHGTGPNPWKVAIVLEELGIPYENKFLEFPEMKAEPYLSINPNGRVPAIEDPNTGITLWESGAIIEYLIAEYDKEHKLSFSSSPEKYLTQQWLHFQVSGQGPYFGQAAWFTHFHSEKLPSAQARYMNEWKRVTKVLDGVLAKSEGGWLVGGKCTYADLSFVTWYALQGFIDQKGELKTEEESPHATAWIKKLNERPAVKKVLQDRIDKISKK